MEWNKLNLKSFKTDEIKNEIYEIENREQKINWNEKVLKYEAGNNKYGFQKYETTRSFFESIYAVKISTQDAGMDQTNLLNNIVNLITNLDQKQKNVRIKMKYFQKWNFSNKRKTRERIKSINSEDNASKITNSTCASKRR